MVIDPHGKTSLKPVVSIDDVMKHVNVKADLTYIEKEYTDFLISCRKMIKRIQNNKATKSDLKLHWELGNLIVNFLQRLNEIGYILVKISDTLSRDITLSPRYIGYHIQLKEFFPEIISLPNDLKWSLAMELLNVKNSNKRQKYLREILSGKIKNREELRKIKRLNK